jgi:hypothetical protein
MRRKSRSQYGGRYWVRSSRSPPLSGAGSATICRSRSYSSSSASDSLEKSNVTPPLRSTAWVGRPWPRSKSATAAEMRAAGGAFGSFITAASVSMASCVSSRAAVPTSAIKILSRHFFG